MKNLVLLVFVAFSGITACEKDCGCVAPPSIEPTCIQAKITAFQTANKDFTSVKRYFKNNDYFWLFDNGAAFDAPQHLLNATCDTVCTWAFSPNRPPCQANFNLGDSTAVVIWKK